MKNKIASAWRANAGLTNTPSRWRLTASPSSATTSTATTLCQLALQKGFNFIFVCKPDSHATLYERLAFWQQTNAIKEVERRCRRGRVIEMMMYRYINDVSLRGGQGALSVNWFEITSVHAKTGAQLYYNSFITNHHITDDNVAHLAQAGRGRWKIENENNNVLKTKGYHIEHNFGHGKKYLAAFMLSLNLLACLFYNGKPLVLRRPM